MKSSVYKIIITERAVKDIEKLDIKTKKRIGTKLKHYSKEPFKYATKLINTSIGTYRFRIGNYRVVFDIDEDKIIILRVGHRKDIYK